MSRVEPQVYFASDMCCVKDSEIHGKGEGFPIIFLIYIDND